ncbi:propanediol utilization protein [Candidatus Parcubacteria bacterium]|nr:MAG: propanediol utilization protein [Candidatus Parcubacteria bacterium]
MKNFKIRVEVSARHCHLNEKDFKKLFGAKAKLTPIKKLTQVGEFASKETIALKTKKGEISRVRIIGPLRDYSQVELSGTDSFRLGLTPPVRMSGDLKSSAPVTIIGPKGKVNKRDVVIIANRHIHANPEQAKKLGLKNKQIVSAEILGDRALVFKKVKVKIHEKYDLSMHIDTDEANACGLDMKKAFAKIIKN